MSIISEALKKANAERQTAGRPSSNNSSGRSSGRVVTTLCVLALVIAPFLFPRLLNRSSGQMESGRPSAALPTIGLADAPEMKSRIGIAQMSVESRDLGTFTGPVTKVVEPAQPVKTDSFVLQGTVWTQNKGRYAILNTNVVREGSMVGDYRVERIGDGQITLSNGAQKLTIDKTL